MHIRVTDTSFVDNAQGTVDKDLELKIAEMDVRGKIATIRTCFKID